LFINQPELVYGIMAAFLVANLIMFAVMISLAGKISRLMYVKRAYLLPPIMVLCIIGSYAKTSTMFPVWVMLGFGVLGFFLERSKVPLGPFVIGFVLAPLAEEKLRTGLTFSGGSYAPLFTRPVCLVFMVISVLLLAWPLVSQVKGWRAARKAKP
jgi:putative tricarboxylic transport membrane protein